jgi:hypothetical protein
MRRDQAKTPPKPDNEIVAKAANSSQSVGAGEGSGFCAGGSVESGVGAELMKFV